MKTAKGEERRVEWFWAPEQTMFSRGNAAEKGRIARLENGIGYFTLPYLVAGAKEVWACEINPWSIEGLKHGASRLKISYDVLPTSDTSNSSCSEPENANQDCRLHILPTYNHLCLSHFRNRAQHVSLGILPSARLPPSFSDSSCSKDEWSSPPSSGLWVGIRALKLDEEGDCSVLRVHEELELSRASLKREAEREELEVWGEEVRKVVERLLEERWVDEGKQGRFRVNVQLEYLGKVKSMGPNVLHVVGDFRVV
ncbi:hypothetical protein BT69DRAFT_1318791, partial [Atractiella rhizophila]